MPSNPISTRDVGGERGGQKMFVDIVAAAQKLENSEPDGDGEREPDRRPDRITPATQSQKPKTRVG